MVEYARRVRIELPERQSAFRWGPRKTGKSTFPRSAFPESVVLDLLKTDLMLELTRRPALLRERLLALEADRLARPIVLGEVQKVPALLDDVH